MTKKLFGTKRFNMILSVILIATVLGVTSAQWISSWGINTQVTIINASGDNTKLFTDLAITTPLTDTNFVWNQSTLSTWSAYGIEAMKTPVYYVRAINLVSGEKLQLNITVCLPDNSSLSTIGLKAQYSTSIGGINTFIDSKTLTTQYTLGTTNLDIAFTIQMGNIKAGNTAIANQPLKVYVTTVTTV